MSIATRLVICAQFAVMKKEGRNVSYVAVCLADSVA